jgi:hypothetical protein
MVKVCRREEVRELGVRARGRSRSSSPPGSVRRSVTFVDFGAKMRVTQMRDF